ncbi:unnamed protein product [Vicia faba]|uniref:Uncharacterized protein n=1 Tax=Vicia faba TaxID=3906 RepID=A0AAV1AMK5_VICFA|nr:unnamed protein product [Vicia faba]
MLVHCVNFSLTFKILLFGIHKWSSHLCVHILHTPYGISSQPFTTARFSLSLSLMVVVYIFVFHPVTGLGFRRHDCNCISCMIFVFVLHSFTGLGFIVAIVTVFEYDFCFCFSPLYRVRVSSS